MEETALVMGNCIVDLAGVVADGSVLFALEYIFERESLQIIKPPQTFQAIQRCKKILAVQPKSLLLPPQSFAKLECSRHIIQALFGGHPLPKLVSPAQCSEVFIGIC